MKFKTFFYFFFLVPTFFCQTDTLKKINLDWQTVVVGLDYCETAAPYPSIINDSKITFVKINPNYFAIDLLTATNGGKKALPVDHWADSFQLNIAINAGMYELSKPLISRGFMQNKKHFNNPNLHPTFNSMLAFQPKNSLESKIAIHDLKCNDWNACKNKYHCYVQSLRMIDCDGNPVWWNKRKQSCSMLFCALDDDGYFYLIYCRSPYSHNEMIQFMQLLPIKLKNAMYLEGGPQTSLYIDIQNDKNEQFCLEKVGSYVSETYETDKNNQFWKLPNVIGFSYLPNKIQKK